MKVRATKLGYYNHRRQRPGAEFFLKKKEHFSKLWMEEVSKSAKPQRSRKPVEVEEEPEAEVDSNSEVI